MALTAEQFFQHTASFLEYRKTVYETSDETMRSNRIDLNLFRDFVEKNHYESIDGQLAIDFQYELKKHRHNSGPSLNRKLFTLRSYAKFLQSKDVEDAHSLPFGHVPKVRSGYARRPNFLTLPQLKQLFDAIDRTHCLGIRDYAIYALMYELGLRVGEVHRLKLDDLDLKDSSLKVSGKGNRERTLYLTQEMQNILCEWLSVRNAFYKSQETDALFISKKGNPISIRTIEDNFQKLWKIVQIQARFKATPHTLRHSFATHLNEKEVDILVIQSLLGHNSPRSTQIYIHATEQKIKDALERLPAIQHLNLLIETGVLRLKFQSDYRRRAG